MPTPNSLLIFHQICQRFLARKHTLTVHIRRHKNERPFKCEDCDSRFVDGSDLSRHRSVMYTNWRPFHCDICSRVFPTKAKLRSHKRVHTGETPHKCPLCSMASANSSNLARHMRTQHAEVKRISKRPVLIRIPDESTKENNRDIDTTQGTDFVDELV